MQEFAECIVMNGSFECKLNSQVQGFFGACQILVHLPSVCSGWPGLPSHP